MIGCECAVCRSTDLHDRRRGPDIIESASAATRPISILVDRRTFDAGAHPRRAAHADAILFTPATRIILGLDEVRRFNVGTRAPLPCYADALTIKDIRRPCLHLRTPDTPAADSADSAHRDPGALLFRTSQIVPVPIFTAATDSASAWNHPGLTDCSRIPDESGPARRRADTVVDALRDRPHPTHFSVKEALEVERIAPERACFTHICHDLPRQNLCAPPRGIGL